jgi:hypothetical protein
MFRAKQENPLYLSAVYFSLAACSEPTRRIHYTYQLFIFPWQHVQRLPGESIIFISCLFLPGSMFRAYQENPLYLSAVYFSLAACSEITRRIHYIYQLFISPWQHVQSLAWENPLYLSAVYFSLAACSKTTRGIHYIYQLFISPWQHFRDYQENPLYLSAVYFSLAALSEPNRRIPYTNQLLILPGSMFIGYQENPLH